MTKEDASFNIIITTDSEERKTGGLEKRTFNRKEKGSKFFREEKWKSDPETLKKLMNNNLPSEMKAKRFVRVRGFFMAFFLEQKTIYLDELLTIIIPHNAVEQ
ncbi:MAG: hypothetical protein QM279_01260 [Atribacterota bacterium]|nr:hypothetical protein [Atribacterota bacterium]HHT10456.1 hypothetical protein [Candidatus Atribacteria bacterium]